MEETLNEKKAEDPKQVIKEDVICAASENTDTLVPSDISNPTIKKRIVSCSVESEPPYSIIVQNLSSRVDFQGLKYFMRQAGVVKYAIAHGPEKNEGIVEFATYADLKNALKKLNRTQLSGRRIKLNENIPPGRSMYAMDINQYETELCVALENSLIVMSPVEDISPTPDESEDDTNKTDDDMETDSSMSGTEFKDTIRSKRPIFSASKSSGKYRKVSRDGKKIEPSTPTFFNKDPYEDKYSFLSDAESEGKYSRISSASESLGKYSMISSDTDFKESNNMVYSAAESFGKFSLVSSGDKFNEVYRILRDDNRGEPSKPAVSNMDLCVDKCSGANIEEQQSPMSLSGANIEEQQSPMSLSDSNVEEQEIPMSLSGTTFEQQQIPMNLSGNYFDEHLNPMILSDVGLEEQIPMVLRDIEIDGRNTMIQSEAEMEEKNSIISCATCRCCDEKYDVIFSDTDSEEDTSRPQPKDISPAKPKKSTIKLSKPIRALKYVPNRPHLLLAASGNEILKVNTETQEVSSLGCKHLTEIWDIDINSTGTLFSTASRDETCCLWTYKEASLLRRFKDHENSVTAVRFHPIDKFLVTGSSDWDVRVWDIETETTVRCFSGHRSEVFLLECCSDTKKIASVDADGVVKLWDCYNGTRICDMQCYKENVPEKCLVTSMSFRGENFLAMCSNKGVMRIWDVRKPTAVYNEIFEDIPLFLKSGQNDEWYVIFKKKDVPIPTYIMSRSKH